VKTALLFSLTGVVLLVASASFCQARFRITYTPRPPEASSVVLDGRVFNDADRDVLDVWVKAEAVNASGKVLATGLGFVGPSIRGHGSAAFAAKVPFVEGTQTFRLAVNSYRESAAFQSP
jgi:hypothetical protein